MQLMLGLLGAFEVRRDGEVIHEFRAQSVRALLAYLALELGRPHEREHLCALLWPDEPLPEALTNLRKVLHRLRQAIEPQEDVDHFLIITRQSVQLNHDTVTSDFALIQAAFQEVAAHRHRSPEGCLTCAAHLEAVVPLYRDELLPGFSMPESAPFEQWLTAKREQVQAHYCQLLNLLSAYYERRTDLNAAITILRRWTEIDPWNETAQLRLITMLAQSDQSAAALRQFNRYQSVLKRDLHIQPSPNVRRLVADIQAGSVPRPTTPQLLQAPVSASKFVGRTAELAKLTDYLNHSDCRLVTITGMGGSGKTRLATATAQAVCLSFRDGAVFVPLAAIHSAAQVAQVLGTALNITAPPNHALEESLRQWLQQRELLLVFDNCEQVEGIGLFIANLLKSVPNLTVLATSRTPLYLQQEWMLPIGGLDFPEISATPPAPDQYPAGKLLLQAAHRINPEAVVSNSQFTDILECCTLLEGHPLALELAAARLREYHLREIVAIMRDNPAILSTVMGDLPQRQRSLRAVFDWSWRLLDAEEQRALTYLTVFRGGCSRAALEAVIGDTEPVHRLIAHSLVRRDANGRFSLHEQIRQFATAYLEQSGHACAVHTRHCRYYLELAGSYRDAVGRSNESTAVAAIRSEYQNLAQAWEYAMALDDITPLIAAAPIMGRMYARSDTQAGIDRFQQTLTQLRPIQTGYSETYLHIQDILLALLRNAGRMDSVALQVDDMQTRARAVGNRLSEAAALMHRAEVAMYRRETMASLEALKTAEYLCTDDQSVRGRTLLAYTLYKQAEAIDWQQLPVDLRYAEEAYKLNEALGLIFRTGLSLNRLGYQYQRLGNYGRALEMRRKAVNLVIDQGDHDITPLLLSDLGTIYMELGAYAEAREPLVAGLAMARRVGMVTMEIFICSMNARLHYHLGDLHTARTLISEALAMCTGANAHIDEGYLFTVLGCIAEAEQKWIEASLHYRDALHWWEASGIRSNALFEPLCGLARINMVLGQQHEAVALIEKILNYPEAGSFMDIMEPMRVYLTCYHVLHAIGDPRAVDVLQHGYTLLQQQANQIDLPELRAGFLTLITANHAICALYSDHVRTVAA